MGTDAREAVGGERAGGLLAVDVGNTVTRLGLFDGGELVATWEATTPERCTSDEARLVVTGFLDALARRRGAGKGDAAAVAGACRPADAILSASCPTSWTCGPGPCTRSAGAGRSWWAPA